MTDKGVSESLFSLETELVSGNRFLSLSDEVYEQMVLNSKPLHRSLYAMTSVVAKIAWRDQDFEEYTIGFVSFSGEKRIGLRSFDSFEGAYQKARILHGQPPDQTRIDDIYKYSQVMQNDMEAEFPNPILRKQGGQLVQIDGARRLMARLLAGQTTTEVYVVMLREDLQDILNPDFVQGIKDMHKTKRWFNAYQDIFELGINGTRRFGGRFPDHLDLSPVKGHKVVDFGCNNGMALFQAYYCGASSCIGFDYIQENVDIVNVLASHLHIPVEAHRCDFNNDDWEDFALKMSGGWDYSLFLSVYRTKELKDRKRLLKFIWENSKIGMFFEGHGHPQLDDYGMYHNLLSGLNGSGVKQLPKGIIERPYYPSYTPKFLVSKLLP